MAISLSGCTGSTSPGSNAASGSNTSVPVTESVGEATLPPASTIELPERFTTTLDGTIGTLPIRVRMTKDKGLLTGSYVYETNRAAMRTVLEVLTLEGSIDPAGAVRVSESASNPKGSVVKTGAFEGTLTNTTLGKRFVGRWTKPDGTFGLPVVLNELAFTPGGIRFVSTPMASTDKRLAATVTVAVPRAEGGDRVLATAFSTAVEIFARERVREFEQSARENLGERVAIDAVGLEIDYEIAVATDEIVSIVFTEYSNVGGAHPSISVYGRTYEFARGRFLTLTDVTGDTRALLALVSQKCQTMHLKDEAFQTDLDPVAENYSEWYVTRRGMTFVFPVVHVAGDTMQAYLPFPEIKVALNPEGPLGTLIR